MSEPEKRLRRRVKKVKAHGGHHGGAWKVAYADFVTAMMALFLVLWLVSQADTKLKAAIASYFRAPGVFDTLQGGVIEGPKKVSKEQTSLTSKDDEQSLFSAAALLQKKFSERPEFTKFKDQIKIEVTEQGLRIQIVDKAERISFSSGSASLTPDASLILAEVARGICSLPNPILVGGHTDRHLFPSNSIYTNWELSADRANAARRELEANCVKPEQIRRIVGYADTELFVPDDPYATSNRRISITVMRLHGDAQSSAEGTRPTEEKAKPGDTQSVASGDNAATAPATAPPPPPDDKSATTNNTGVTLGDKETAPAAGKGRTVSVGEPDKLPANVKRGREAAPLPH